MKCLSGNINFKSYKNTYFNVIGSISFFFKKRERERKSFIERTFRQEIFNLEKQDSKYTSDDQKKVASQSRVNF